MYWTEIFLAFVAGILVTKILGGLVSLGFSVLIMKQCRDSFLRIAGHASQTLYEIQQMKILEMHRMNKSKNEIEISTSISEHNMKIMRDVMIRGFMNAFPKKYEDLIGFSDWDSAMQCLDELIKKEREKHIKQ